MVKLMLRVQELLTLPTRHARSSTATNDVDTTVSKQLVDSDGGGTSVVGPD